MALKVSGPQHTCPAIYRPTPLPCTHYQGYTPTLDLHPNYTTICDYPMLTCTSTPDYMPTHCISVSDYTVAITSTPTLNPTLTPDCIPSLIHHPMPLQTSPHLPSDPSRTDPMQTPAALGTPVLQDLSPCPTPV